MKPTHADGNGLAVAGGPAANIGSAVKTSPAIEKGSAAGTASTASMGWAVDASSTTGTGWAARTGSAVDTGGLPVRVPGRLDAVRGIEPPEQGGAGRGSVVGRGPASHGRGPVEVTMFDVSPATLDRIRTELAISGAEPTPERVAAALRADGGVYGDAVVLAVVAALRRETIGAGPLEFLLAQPGISDIVVNGPNQVYIDRGGGLEQVQVGTGDERSIRRLATRLAALAGRRLDDSAPYVDVRLNDGTRFHAVLAPIAAPGTCLSLRIPSRRVFTLDDLVASGSLPPTGTGVLRDLVEARLAFLISGGTGTGKTTLLNTLLSLVDPTERVVVVEDASELRPAHPHVVRLESRPPNVEGAGEISLRDLVRQALRMRPDRLVVGEVRGAEAVDLLNALNTGHEGGCGTIHANSAADVPARLEALGGLAGLSRDAVHSQVSSALQAVVHLVRTRDGRRRIAEIRVIDQLPDGRVTTIPAVEFVADGKIRLSAGAGRFTQLLAGAA